MDLQTALPALRDTLAAARLLPYLGAATTRGVPATPAELATTLTKKSAVPFKIRSNLTAAAQYIENFKHRKTLVKLMNEAFAQPGGVCPCRSFLLSRPLPLVVDAWYDDASRQALAGRDDWGEVQGVSQAEHRDGWVKCYDASGAECDAGQAASWTTLLYKPIGGVRPAANYIVSDSDYVEVLTEIDIQTPIPEEVQRRRVGNSFLFLGCRFDNQLSRSFARQIMKRSGDGPHWWLHTGPLTRNEERFIDQQGLILVSAEAEDLCAALA